MAIIRLLLLTGCRMGEIITLKLCLYRESTLFLPDSKRGPRDLSKLVYPATIFGISFGAI